MTDSILDVKEIYSQMDLMDTIDVGLVVVDLNYNVHLWNNFMQNYSGVGTEEIMNKSLFSVLTDLPVDWLKAKINASVELASRAFSNWEDKPHIFDFDNYSPLTDDQERMYQNLVITPLKSNKGSISHVCLMIQDVSEVAVSKLHLKQSNEQLKALSRIDGLTKLFNRGYWESRLLETYEQCKLTRDPATIVMLDIDHFKNINDTHGHGVGDDAIRGLSDLLRNTTRKFDLPGRYGGEEFAVLLPGTSAEQAYYFAERLRKQVETFKVEVEERELQFTISLGIAEMTCTHTTHLEWLESADKALYYSKEGGRNQTSIFKNDHCVLRETDVNL